ncbi:TlpA family protein disulfide reductase [Polaribacter septentrionalilitoris]|uniref:TlpA family protein disulfide reductase n=1 Tax=Polaribacter septentrionalilitoris TaxID=2494657 RepID=UPI00135B25AC|nr:TlpA disulfide reductase family protein [Polaribacter septentrionalilitoris]
MKKFSSLVLLVILITSCTKTPKDYITLSGKLENNTDSIISITGRSGVLKKITINEDGTFKDTLKVTKSDIYTFQTSRTKRAPLYLKNGFVITINGDANEFMTSFDYSGYGASNSNLIIAQLEEAQKIGNPAEIFQLKDDAFKNKVNSLKKSYDSILSSYNDIDSSLLSLVSRQNQQVLDYLNQTYAKNKVMGKGNPSPKFEGYVDIKGGKKSLDSFKGKYIYIDVWATWCGPCIQQIPYLKQLEKDYHNKNIEFVSISTDESRRSGGSWDAAEKKWRDFVKEKQLSGVQLWAGQDISFQQAYQISGIPRFILIDPQGNIVDANAPRPSDPRLKELLSSLKI